MPARRVLSPQSVWDVEALQQAFAEAAVKPLHAVKLWSHLVRNPDIAWRDVPDLPKAAHTVLEERFTRCTSSVTQVQRSGDGETIKLLVTLQDGMQVESVIMTYDTSGRYNATPSNDDDDAASEASSSHASTRPPETWGHRRATLCVSSQVGCQMGCTFCSTGTMGLKANLTCGEILEQLVHARRVTPIRNVVFMGMGEPLNNYDAVRPAVGMMTHARYFALRRERVTISTVGVIPRIKQMPDDLPGVALALSLHAPNQELRSQIVPSARAYKLDRLMDAVKEFEERTKLRLFVEYVMLAGVNDGQEQAHELGKLLEGHDAMLNLIPWNPVYSPDGPKFAAPSDESIAEFSRTVRFTYGISCTVRCEKGQDISGACGQLVIEAQDPSKSTCSSQVTAAQSTQAPNLVRDIEELAVKSK